MNFAVQVASALLGSCGFALLCNHKGCNILISTVGGGLTWGVYLLFACYTESIFLLNIAAAVFAAMYSEIMARIRKVPATAFTITSIIPLVPGGSLYYTLRYIITEERDKAISYGTNTLLAASGIAVGIVLVSILFKYISKFKRMKKL